ncbi:MAG: flagellar biosynthesis protein FlhB [Bacillota bacterium]|nr:flagellar biosynthesis protein FlhB [Bacillota bacterium]MDK2881723.1 flagellar biosynthesis protein FlhB [Bacillota bacterium]MDK2959826.1 flagellar biosynthesis protein FlhB [Bacillota bacterium]
MEPFSYSYLQADPKLRHFNLQLFAGEEKTEPATPHRRQEARRKGQVFHSLELNAAAVLLASSMAVFFLLPLWQAQLIAFTKETFLTPGADWEVADAYRLLLRFLLQFAYLALPVLLAGLAAALLVSYLQVGFVFSSEPVAFRLERLNPVAGLGRIFSRRSLATLVRNLVKLVVVAWVAASSIRSEYALIPRLPLVGLEGFLAFLGKLSWRLAWQCGLAVLVLAVFDFLYQRWEYEQSLRMSRQEIKEELRETEGRPEVRARVRERQRQLARARMLHRVPEADVVITNPTHYAVALKYDAARMAAPEVIAKGAGLIAERIKKLAREHGVSIVENKPLAQALYRTVEVGESIPATFYRAVAEVLAYVYRQKGLI